VDHELNDDGRRCGVALHAVIGELAESHRFDISGGELLAYVGAHPQIASLASYKAAGRQRVSGGVATYLRWFAPASWRFIGREMDFGDRRVDVVWDTGLGVVFDEIKSDRVVVARDTSAHTAQTVALLEAGKATYAAGSWASD
jgi:hypothetical protein